MTVAVSTLNHPTHQTSTAHKRLPPSPASAPVPSSSPSLSPSLSPASSQLRPSHRAPFSLRSVLRSPRVYRVLVVLALTVTVALALFYVPLRTLRFVATSFAPRLSPPNISASLFALRRHGRTLLHSYQRMLHVRPLISRAITAAIIFLLADLIAQLLARPRHKPFLSVYSPARQARYSSYGLLFMGPLLYVWYDAMNRFGPPDDMRGSMLKCIFEELTLEPFCIAAYVVYDGLLTRKPYRLISRTIRTRIIPLWFNNSAFWMPANFANYYVGTPDMRVVFSNLCSLFWNVYFSSKINQTNPAPSAIHQAHSTSSSPSDDTLLPLSKHSGPAANPAPLHQRPDRTTATSRRPAATTIPINAITTSSPQLQVRSSHTQPHIHPPPLQPLTTATGRARSPRLPTPQQRVQADVHLTPPSDHHPFHPAPHSPPPIPRLVAPSTRS